MGWASRPDCVAQRIAMLAQNAIGTLADGKGITTPTREYIPNKKVEEEKKKKKCAKPATREQTNVP